MGGNALAAAVDIVGGQAKLARLLGVTQPNVWHWLHKSERVPGEYVLKIEEATGGKVSRHDLRPDLYPANMTKLPPRPGLPDEERVRADCYRLLGRLLAAPPGAELLDAVGRMLGGQGELGAALDALAAAARGTDAEAASREYHDLFIGLARGELVPFASYYRTGFLYDKPLAKLGLGRFICATTGHSRMAWRCAGFRELDAERGRVSGRRHAEDGPQCRSRQQVVFFYAVFDPIVVCW